METMRKRINQGKEEVLKAQAVLKAIPDPQVNATMEDTEQAAALLLVLEDEMALLYAIFTDALQIIEGGEKA